MEKNALGENALSEDIKTSLQFKVDDMYRAAECIKREIETREMQLKRQWTDFVQEHNVEWTTVATRAGVSLVDSASKTPREAFYANVRKLSKHESNFGKAEKMLQMAQQLFEKEKAARFQLLKSTLEVTALKNVDAVAEALEKQFRVEANKLLN
jgi:hypothetical protein